MHINRTYKLGIDFIFNSPPPTHYHHQKMLLPSSGTISFMALAIGVLVMLASHLLALPSQSKGGIHNLGGIPILAAWGFYTKWYDFLWKHFNSGKKYFQFHILQVFNMLVFFLCTTQITTFTLSTESLHCQAKMHENCSSVNKAWILMMDIES